jgi:hypothetical protein
MTHMVHTATKCHMYSHKLCCQQSYKNFLSQSTASVIPDHDRRRNDKIIKINVPHGTCTSIFNIQCMQVVLFQKISRCEKQLKDKSRNNTYDITTQCLYERCGLGYLSPYSNWDSSVHKATGIAQSIQQLG